MTQLPPPLPQIERTTCDCRQCQAGCRAQPGHLVPGDAERIAAYIGIPVEQLRDTLLRVSEGATVLTTDGSFMQIPTIVPEQRENGECVFFNGDTGRCTIHPVSPFGCSRFSICSTETHAYEQAKSKAGFASIVRNPDYQQMTRDLAEADRLAIPLARRKAMLGQLLTDIKNGIENEVGDESETEQVETEPEGSLDAADSRG